VALTHRRQPARRLLVSRDLTTREAADFIGCTTAHLANVLRGRAYPSVEVRAQLPVLLGLPIQVLFEQELLDGEYTGRRGYRAVAK
jgi:transcriptional regulator with XRE-family HTH domain